MNFKRLIKIPLIGILLGTLIACDSDDDSLLSEIPNRVERELAFKL